MSKNRGKKFEDVIKQSFLEVDGVDITRLRDAPRKMKNVDNPSDFIVYKKPYEIDVECKSHKGNTLPFSCIREEQITGMLEKSKIEGVLAGVIVWFIDHDKTLWLPIKSVEWLMFSGDKSLNIKHFDGYLEWHKGIEIQGKKKRIYFDYDMEDFLRRLYDRK